MEILLSRKEILLFSQSKIWGEQHVLLVQVRYFYGTYSVYMLLAQGSPGIATLQINIRINSPILRLL